MYITEIVSVREFTTYILFVFGLTATAVGNSPTVIFTGNTLSVDPFITAGNSPTSTLDTPPTDGATCANIWHDVIIIETANAVATNRSVRSLALILLSQRS
jgi:hypothetical protein